MDHDPYDRRRYPIVGVREGYGEWVATYERTVPDEMDLRLLERLQSVDWERPTEILDLACGTGRIGGWLRERTEAPIDGVDLTGGMLDVARGKGVYRALELADVTATGLPAESYDLCVQSLADEHLPELQPLYTEVVRVTRPGGLFVLAGIHPHLLMAGMPTHFDRAPGDSVTIRSYVHLLSDHVKAAHALGLSLMEMEEGLVDEALLDARPSWTEYAGVPASFALVWRLPSPRAGE
jgi:SAM-dependent methyltransferase